MTANVTIPFVQPSDLGADFDVSGAQTPGKINVAAVLKAASVLFQGNFSGAVAAWWATLPTIVPDTDGTPWNDGGVLAITSGAPVWPSSIPAALFGAAFSLWFLTLPQSLPSGAGQFWNNGGLAATPQTPAQSAALAILAGALPFNFGAAFAAWFATLPTAPVSTAQTLWNNNGVLAYS